MEESGRGRAAVRTRTPLTRQRIILAGVTLADATGVDSLSMRALARSLRVEAMSLYNHITDRNDLVDGMVDHVIGEIALPAVNEHWRSALRHHAISAHEMLVRHPWAAMLMGLRLNVGPNMLRRVEAVLARLVGAGFTYELADHALNALDNHIRGFTLQEVNFPISPADYAQAARDYLPNLPVETYPHLHGLALRVGNGTYDGLNDFSFGLDLILDGLERLVTQVQRPC